jgi:Glycosyltransferase
MKPRAIWLCSWYPNREDPHTGDFVQRHAQAVSSFVEVYVIHVALANQSNEAIHHQSSGLTEVIYYIPKRNKIIDFLNRYIAYKKAIKSYIQEKGIPDIVHVHIPYPAGIAAWWLYRTFKKKYVVTEHYGIYEKDVEYNYTSRSYFFQYWVKKIFKQAEILMPVSRYLGKAINKMVLTKPFICIPNVVNTSLFYYDNSQKQETFTFIHVSDYSNNKNVMGILMAIQRLRQKMERFQLYCMGGDSSPFQQFIKENNLQNHVKFFPLMSQADLAHHVRKAHVGILFSHHETQSCVILEWLCAGLPVVASNVGGVTELINQTNGVLVADNDIEALAEALFQVKKNYTTYQHKQIALQASELYSYETVGRQIAKTYHNMMNGQPST